MLSAHVILASVAVYILLAERLFLRFSTGGRGILPILDLWTLGLAIMLLAFTPERRAAAFLRNRDFWRYSAPYVGLSLVLPFMGVLFNDYPARSALGSLLGIQTCTFLIFGSWIAVSGPRVWRMAKGYAFATILLQFSAAALQFAYRKGVILGPLSEHLYRWDVASQLAYSERYVVTARSIGTYINPNTLGVWADLACWSAAFAFKGVPRVIGIAAALCTLFFSESRGSTLALMGSFAVWFLYLGLSRDAKVRAMRDVGVVMLCCVLLVGAWTALIFQDRLLEDSATNRFERGLRFLMEGGSADRNAQGRLQSWSRALAFFENHPFGTLGEPRFMFQDIIDNDYVRTLLQGSLVYLAAFLAAMFGTLRQMSKHGRLGLLLGTFTAVICINAVTAHPLSYPVVSIYWMAAAFYFGLTARTAALQTAKSSAPLYARHPRLA
jgi:hypothetical protein